MVDSELETNVSSAPRLSPGLKRLLVLFAIINGLIGIKRSVDSLLPPQLYKKDFVQEYLLAKATLSGVNPYLPMPELAGMFLSGANYSELQHPTPHPPGVGLLCLPLAALDYEIAAVLWFFFELACLLASVLLLLRWWGEPVRVGVALALYGLALGWAPVAQDLWFGQLNACLLLLLLLAWLSLRAGKDALGSALLGGMIALKLMAWPVVIFLALRRRWRGVVAAGATTLAAHLVAATMIGSDYVRDYYLKIGPLLASIYRQHDSNFSVWTWGERLFAGGGENFWAPPLWSSAPLAQAFTFLAPIAVLSAALLLAFKARSFDTSFGLLVCAGILVSPIAWTHYLMLASIPIVVVACRLWTIGLPRRIAYPALGLLFALSLTQSSFAIAACSFANDATPDGLPIVPFAAGLITLIPAVALTGLILALWRSDYMKSPRDSQPATSAAGIPLLLDQGRTTC